ncbi:MAG: YafY family protein [Verrucomicrobiota bacterium]
MNRVDRLVAIALRLQSRRVVRAEDLAAHFEISVRTVYRDLAALGEAGVPIIGEPGVGYSLVKGYHLPPVMFTAEEASALFFGEKLVAQFTDASLRKQMETALLKIRSVLPRDRQDYLDRLERATAVVSCPSQNIPRLASEALIPLQRALAERRVLALDYLGGQRREVTKRDVEPLGLIYYAENWHLIAHCRLRRDVRDFRTDRILKLALRDERFIGRDNFSLKQYLETQQQPDGDFVMVQLRFQPEAMERVRREHHWGLVEEKPTAAGVTVTLLTPSFEWLTGWVLSFGVKVEALGPERFRQLVAAEAQQLAARYAPVPPLPPVAVNRPQPTRSRP